MKQLDTISLLLHEVRLRLEELEAEDRRQRDMLDAVDQYVSVVMRRANRGLDYPDFSEWCIERGIGV